MAFDHENDVYRLAVQFSSWVGERLEGSALECAACLDTLVARKRMDPLEAEEGKQLLERIVSMLWRMIKSQ